MLLHVNGAQSWGHGMMQRVLATNYNTGVLHPPIKEQSRIWAYRN